MTTTSSSRRLESLLAAEQAGRVVLQQYDSTLVVVLPSASSPNPVWREKVAQWYYDVADHLGERRSIVYLAMSILDRYCTERSIKGIILDEREYELSSMTAMFLAIRIAGSEVLRIQDLLRMSRDGLTVREFIDTGTDMIKALSWDHRVTTPADFLAVLLDFLPPTSRRAAIVEMASYVMELSVCDISLSHCKASDIALAAVMNALRSIHGNGDVDLFARSLKACVTTTTSSTLSRGTWLAWPTSPAVTSLRNRLQRLYSLSVDSRPSSGPHLVMCEEDEELEQAQGSNSDLTWHLPHQESSGSGRCHVHHHQDALLTAADTVDAEPVCLLKRSVTFNAANPQLKRAKMDLSQLS